MFHFLRSSKNIPAADRGRELTAVANAMRAPCITPGMYCCGAPNGMCVEKRQSVLPDYTDRRPSPIVSLMFSADAEDQSSEAPARV